MVRIGMFFVLALFFFSFVSAAVVEDTQLLDAANQEEQEVYEEKASSLEFTSFSSCQSMEHVLQDFLQDFPERRWGGRMMKGAIMDMQEDMVAEEAAPMMADVAVGGESENTTSAREVTSSHTDFSQTNIQKEFVDEPEILKTNEKYMFYYNGQERAIYVLASPLNRQTSKIDLNTAAVQRIIRLPENFQNIQLFVTDSRLVVTATRYMEHEFRILERNNRTSVAVYDIQNISSLKLLSFVDMDGRYRDARLIGNKLYVLSQLGVNWRSYRGSEEEDADVADVQAKDVVPGVVQAVITNGKVSAKKIKPDCKSISYVLPSKETIKQMDMYPAFTLIGVLDIDQPKKDMVLNVLLASVDQIHMSQKNLYITQTARFPGRWQCGWGRRCFMPRFDGGQQTLIHKFGVNAMNVGYKTTTMVPGSVLTQYSMDEDTAGNFRILTRKDWTDGTNFYVFDPSLTLAGKITGIEPGEQFKASRYIGDKLYLVTFEQTDPLFVIDVADTTDPKIIGELKIPGFSTYLHPLKDERYTCEELYGDECHVMDFSGDFPIKKQHLIGLGYDVQENQRGGTVQAGLKLSLYEIDYAKKETAEAKCGKLVTNSISAASEEYQKCLTNVNKDNIYVAELASQVIGGKGSWSEAMENPRLFVMDPNKVVSLPVVLQNEVKKGEQCNVYKDANGVETKSNCYPVTQQQTAFAGLKSFSFDPSKGITETFSVDYLSLFKKLYKPYDATYEDFSSRELRNTAMRVGFAGDALYMINNDFVHFTIPGYKDQSKYLYLDPVLKKPTQQVTEEDLITAKKEITAMVVTTCTQNAQCQTLAMGAKPCGGPWDYLIYSTQGENIDTLKQKVQAYTRFEEAYNKEKGLSSDCMYVEQPVVACVHNVCVKQ